MRKTTASSQDVIDQRETTKQEEMHRPVTPTAFAFSAAERAGGRTDKMHQATFSRTVAEITDVATRKIKQLTDQVISFARCADHIR